LIPERIFTADIRRFFIVWYLMPNMTSEKKARLVAGGNRIVNDKEDIYSGVVCMDTVRIGLFLGELYGFSCCA